MKWIMTIAAAAAIAGGTVAAQAGQSMAAHDKMGGMAKADVSYTGCVESSGSAFSLTRAVATGTSMKHDAMKHDGMAHEGMAHDTMKSDGMKPDTMKSDTMKADGMKHDAMKDEAMMAKTLSLSSPSVDLRKHVGQKVAVTGSPAASNEGMTGSDASAFVVTSVKVLAKSCS